MNTEQLEHVIALAQRVLQLRSELREAEQELARAAHAIPETAAVLARNGNEQHRQDDQQGDAQNLVERVIRLLNRNPQRPFTAGIVLDELGLPLDRLHSVRSTLWLLAKKGRITNTARGQFCAMATPQGGQG